MRNHMDYNQACTGLVQNYIGTAFDVVKAVYDNLDSIKTIADNISDGDFEEILDISEEINELIALLKDYNNRYYGPLPTEPTTRPDGTPSTEGDMYYNTASDQMFYLREDVWVVIGEGLIGLEVHKITEADVTTGGTTINLKNTYTPGANNLMVFVNSAYQYSVSNEHPDGGYQEVDPNTLLFPYGYLEVDDIVAVMTGDNISSISVDVDVEIQRHLTNLEGEKFITIPGGMVYTPSQDNLEVFVNGLRQTLNVDYTETSSTTVTFVEGLGIDSVIVFKKGHAVGTSTKDTSDEFQILEVVSDFFNMNPILNQNTPIFLKGFNTPSDGGAGFFLYDPLAPRLEANGGTSIDATVSIPDQGSGPGNGCWIRQYSHGISSRWFGKEVATAADFYTIGFGNNGDYFELDGYRTAGDGGEGAFYWDEDKPKTAHDGATVIDPHKIFPNNWNEETQMRLWFNPGVSGFGCWVRPHPEEVTVNWFGAQGDGIEDASLVFDVIGTAIESKTIDRLGIPAGTYNVSNYFICEVLARDTLFELYGQGEVSKISFSEEADDKSFRFINCNGLKIHNIAFVDTRSTSGTGLNFINCSEVEVRDCYFDDFKGNSISLTENPDTFEKLACNDVSLISNVFRNCLTNTGNAVIELAPKIASKGIIVVDNRFTACGEALNGPVIRASSGMEKGMIRLNQITEAQGNAIEVSAYESIDLSSNIISDFNNAGIMILAEGTASYPDPSVQGMRCQNNSISLSDGSAFTGTYSIQIEGDKDALGLIILAGNSALRCGGIKISPESPFQNILVTDNIVEDLPLTLYGILADATNGAAPLGIQVTGNFVENEDVTRTQALMKFAGCQDITVRDNSFNRAGTTSLDLTTCSGAKVFDNIFTTSNIAQAVGASIVNIVDANANTYSVKGNYVVKGYSESFVNCSTASPILYISHNILDETAINIVAAGVNPTTDGKDAISQMGINRHFYSTAAPVAGEYEAGDVVWNVQPTAGGQIGWVCVTSGLPGTWKEFGAIQA